MKIKKITFTEENGTEHEINLPDGNEHVLASKCVQTHQVGVDAFGEEYFSFSTPGSKVIYFISGPKTTVERYSSILSKE